MSKKIFRWQSLVPRGEVMYLGPRREANITNRLTILFDSYMIRVRIDKKLGHVKELRY